MALNVAHEGYEYQDLVTAFYILREILNENDSTFKIDSKDHSDDKFDDLTIITPKRVYKNQIKYSNELSDHTATKDDFATSNKYDLALYDLFKSWRSNKDYYYRLCLAWNEPTDNLRNFIKSSAKAKTFENDITKVFEIDIDKLWPKGEQPEKSWRKFRKESINIQRKEFEDFCKELAIELDFPKQSSNESFSGDLEKIVLEQVKRLGIGSYPNSHYTPESFALAILKLITRSRSRGLVIRTKDIFHKFNINTDFGSIEQIFPIDEKKNINTEKNVESFVKDLERESKIVLKGEPGSGKSWFVQNLRSELKRKNYKVVQHYCYTELKDEFAKERITLNVFYGNLIKDILKAFPHLINLKEEKYASNLFELNRLLQNVDKDTLIIIDGLDHIERVFSYKQSDLTLDQVSIIKAIGQLQFSEKVKIVVVSQPIDELDRLSGYVAFQIPNWTEVEMLDYFDKNHIKNFKVSGEIWLHQILLKKSNGNPLYVNYLIEEIKGLKEITIQQINLLPKYNFNLEAYYQYLINKLEINNTIPQILSGVNFSLTKSELTEITHQGKYVEDSLKVLKPILNERYTNGGFIIYHESFRRFILEVLEKNQVNLEMAIFNPIVEWFKSKGFFSYPKAYRYFFQLLFDIGKFDVVLSYLSYDFIITSLYNGQPFETIKNNHNLLAKSALKKADFPSIILVNELSKVLSSTEDIYYSDFNLYFSALGYLKGFTTVQNYLTFEGEPTLPLFAGLEGCYLCDENNEPAPWELYFKNLGGEKEIPIEKFKYYIRGLLVNKETDVLIEAALKTYRNHKEYIPIYASELIDYRDESYLEELKERDKIFVQIIKYKEPSKTPNEDLLNISYKLLEIENVFKKEIPLIKSFFEEIDKNIDDEELIKAVVSLFKGKNWFYNWLVYCIKIKAANSRSGLVNYQEVLEAFNFLIYDTEPFKGKPRTTDLYSLGDFLFYSYKEGLKTLKTEREWQEVIKILIRLSETTTTEIQKSIGGPLPTDVLFQLLDECSNDINRSLIISEFETLIAKKERYQLHSYIAEFYFRLTKLYAIEGIKGKADECFKKGLRFFIGYTYRRDLTLVDLLYSIVNYSEMDNKSGNNYIKKIKSLVDAVVNHTDGKDTRWFPIYWYKKYLKINFDDASLYLLEQIVDGYYWLYEEQLKDLLVSANGKINHIIEAFIFISFPLAADEDFLLYGLNLIERLKVTEPFLSNILTDSITERISNKRNDNFSESLIDRFNLVTSGADLEKNRKRKTHPRKKTHLNESLQINNFPRKQFSDMNISEIIVYFSKNKIKKKHLNSLCYYFDEVESLTSEIEILIQTIVSKYEESPKGENIDLSLVFNRNNEISIYYWVSRFINQRDGWDNFQYTRFFKEAFLRNKKLAIKSLLKQLGNFIGLNGYNRTVSSGLINSFIKVQYDNETIEKMWDSLYKANDYRLPSQEEIPWDRILRNELNLNIEEIFICHLFARFNSNTTERHHWTLSGLCYLYENYPDKMIKPTKWFFRNKKSFLTSNIILILEIIFEIDAFKKGYAKNFDDELKELLPSKYFLINFLVAELRKESMVRKIIKNKPIYVAEERDITFFSSINYRNEILNNKGFSFDDFVGKFKSSYLKEYGESFRFLENRSVKRTVQHIYPSNYQYELINSLFYEEFEDYWDWNDLYRFLKIDYKTIVAQNHSYIKRPDLLQPSQIEKMWERMEVEENEWIRLGYYEDEICGEKFEGTKEHRVLEGIVFNSDLKNNLPFSRYKLYPIHIWNNIHMDGMDEFLCVSLIQPYDFLENYKILWLNSNVIIQLELEIGEYYRGLVAKDKMGEIVLKYNRWASDYVGNGLILGIQDEIPKLEGAELLCRKDYFIKICNLFNLQKPYRYRLKLSSAN